METKCILSLSVARTLLSQGCKLVDVDTSSKRAGKLVFVFERNEFFDQRLAELSKVEER
ncbi:DUF5659 domain-containing protein [Lysinibacillus telephonicus]|uniref:DUF5659 domain-containing protein n=1 Tax=Lysinibacillus telephonicus TaxID=1714840 RepID=UPI003D156A62